MGVLIFVNLGKKNTFGPKNEKFWEITKNIFGPKKKLFFEIWLDRPWIAANLHAGSKKSIQKNFSTKRFLASITFRAWDSTGRGLVGIFYIDKVYITEYNLSIIFLNTPYVDRP